MQRGASGGLASQALRSHLAVAAVGVLGLLIALVANFVEHRAVTRAVERGAPAVRALTDARAGVNGSLAHLRGFMALGQPSMRDSRVAVWQDEIRPALDRLDEVVYREQRDEVASLRALAEDLNEWQWHTAEAAASPENRPAVRLLRDHGRPQFDAMLAAVSAALEDEKPRARTGSGARLAALADTRGALAGTSNALTQMATLGEPTAEIEYRRVRTQLTDALTALRGLGRGSAEQERALAVIDVELARHDHIARAILASWAAGTPDQAAALLQTEAAPRADELELRLNQLLAELTRQLESDQRTVRRLSLLNRALLLLLGVAGAFAAVRISRGAAERISMRVTPLAEEMQRVRRGETARLLEVHGDDEIATMTAGFNEMTSALAASRHDLREQLEAAEADAATKAARAELLGKAQSTDDLAELASLMLAFYAERFDVIAGVLWVQREGTDGFSREATWAYEAEGDPLLRPGDGVPGEALRSCKNIELSPPPAGYLTVRGGLGQGAPGHVSVRPLVFQGEALGVMELARSEPPTPAQRAELSALDDTLGTVIANALASRKVRRLLEETQRQAELLSQQQEEMRQTHAELEHRTEKLELSEAELAANAEELRQTNEELEEQSAQLALRSSQLEERNAELTETSAALMVTAKEVEEASRYKSEFLANMSHELRTPLNSVLILAGLLEEDPDGRLSDKQRDFAGTIKRAGNDLLGLINEILDLAKVESGRLELVLEEVAVEDLVVSLRDLFTPAAHAKDLSLTFTMDGAPSALRTDSQRVLQILRNLLGNAIKFTEAGGVTVEVTADSGAGLGPQGEPTPAVAFDVIDTGIGIPEDRIGAVFEAFQQVDGSTSRRFGGTGLGLSIAREMAAALGGDLGVRSTSGEGTSFRLRLPLSGPPDDVAEDTSGPEAPPPASSPPRRFASEPALRAPSAPAASDQRLILIVEDDPTFGKVVAELAAQVGLRAVVAPTAADARELAGRLRPDAMILDVGLPDASGAELLDELRADPRFADLPVHVISGVDELPASVHEQALGVLRKPATASQMEEVFGRLTEAIAGRRARLLIVEDDSMLRGQLANLLASESVDVEAVPTAQEARDRLAAHRYDCIVLDLGLPDSPGIEFLREIRQSEGPQPAVVVYTGRDLSRDELRELERLGDSVVLKAGRAPERLLEETRLFLHRVGLDRAMSRPTTLPEMDTLGGGTVLLVDDDIRNVYALSAVLETAGLEVHIAENGKEALAQLEQRSFDVILMDMMMPVMDGYEATRAIRADGRWNELPVIALTAKAMKADRQKCLDAGASEYLSKPVDVSRLMSLLGVWLGRSLR